MESLCDRYLRTYAEAIDGQVFHYRDGRGLEADAVIALNDGRWAAVEVKLGSKEIEDAEVHAVVLEAGSPDFYRLEQRHCSYN